MSEDAHYWKRQYLEDKKAWEERDANFKKLVTARVELRAREIAISKGENPNSLLVDAGPVWHMHIRQAKSEIDSIAVKNEDADILELECRDLLDQQLINALWEQGHMSPNSTYIDARRRISQLLLDNKKLKDQINTIKMIIDNKEWL